MSKIFFLFIIGILILIPSAFAQNTPDYSKPYSPIFTDKSVYSWTEKIKISILAPSWNSDKFLVNSIGGDSENSINVSSGDKSLESYKFTETGVNTGIFTAEVILTGFSHDVDGDGINDTNPRTLGSGPSNGFLETDRDSGITISFEFADGVVLTESVPVRWNIGTLEFLDSNLLSEKSALIQVVDPDLNLNPEAIDILKLEVYSDSDIGGIEVTANETSESSGIFHSEITFTQTDTSSGNRLFALPGDSIYSKYVDYTLPKPYSTSENLEITSLSNIISSVPTLEKLENSEPSFTNSKGEKINSFFKDTQFQIIGTITNKQPYNQEFVFIIQIKDEKNSIVSLSWITGQLSENQNLELSQSWVPKTSGEFTVEAYVWNSLTEQIPLSDFRTSSLLVT